MASMETTGLRRFASRKCRNAERADCADNPLAAGMVRPVLTCRVLKDLDFVRT